jgi:hypothetical protein
MSVAAVSTVQQSVSTSSPSRARTIAKHAAIGGVVGAALGAGLSFTALPFIGALSAPIAAAIGGAAGIVVGGLVGFLRSRSSHHEAAAAGIAVGQSAPPPPGTSGTGLPPALPS